MVVSFVSIAIASTSKNTNTTASNIYSFGDIDYTYTSPIPDPDSSVHYPLPQNGGPESPLHLKNPSNITTSVEYKPETNDYLITTQAGGVVISRRYMTFDEYQDWQMDQLMQKYWSQQKQSTIQPNENGDNILNQLLPGLSNITGKLDNLLNRGKPLIEINPSGSAELTFAIVNNKREDPGIDINKRSVTNFDFTENIQINLNAKIGDIIDFDINHNTQAVFDFENKVNLKYEGKEDDILQVLEAGDVSLPLQTKLIQGSESLFGIRSKLKFGKLTIDAVVSNQETESQNMQVQGGAQTEEFEFKADQYEENRHFFLAQYFYDNYNNAMATLPVINSKINILKIEVWRTNIGSAVTENRNILALTDLGERKPSNTQIPQGNSTMPDNYRSNMMFNVLDKNAVRSINNISSYMQNLGMTSGKDYEKVEDDIQKTKLVCPDNNLKVITNFTYNFSLTNREKDLCGNQDNSTNRFVIGMYQYYIFAYSRNQSGTDTNVRTTTYSGEQKIQLEVNYDYTNSVKTINSNGTITTQTFNKSIAPSTNSILLFSDGQSSSTSYFPSLKSNMYKFYDNGKLVRHFVPVPTGLQIGDFTVPSNGMFDIVEQKFYPNQGTGTFTYGKDE